VLTGEKAGAPSKAARLRDQGAASYAAIEIFRQTTNAVPAAGWPGR